MAVSRKHHLLERTPPGFKYHPSAPRVAPANQEERARRFPLHILLQLIEEADAARCQLLVTFQGACKVSPLARVLSVSTDEHSKTRS